MVKKVLVTVGVLVTLGLAAMIVQTIAHRVWDRGVWSCYSALGSGDPLKDRFLIPPACKATRTLVGDLGTPNAQVLLEFRPPRTMWISYLEGTVDYDTYVIELRRHEGVTRARMHHGSD